MAAPIPRVPPVTRATLPISRSSLWALLRRFAFFKSKIGPAADEPARGLCTPYKRDLITLHAHGDAHATTDAERGKPLLGVALLHLMQERDQDARAGRANRMADGDGAAID